MHSLKTSGDQITVAFDCCCDNYQLDAPPYQLELEFNMLTQHLEEAQTFS